MSKLLEQVDRSIRERKLFRRGESILVAVSGGVDSMVLLHLLHALAAQNRWRLSVAHFNHRLRGRSSDADERLVQKTAAALNLPFYAGRGAVKKLAAESGQSIEMVARELRHEFFARTAKHLRVRAVALAHHADDQVELFFLRLLRGTGGEGIAGMKWCSPSPANAKIQLVRPLLDASRADLEQFARENKICFREDSSNASCEFLRNRIRHELLPFLRRRFQPALNRVVSRLIEIVGAEAQFADAVARAWLRKRSPGFGSLATPIARKVLQLQLQRLKVLPDFDLIECLRLSPDKPVAVGPTTSVARDESGNVFITSGSPAEFNRDRIEFELKGRAGQGSFDGLRLHWQIVKRRGNARLERSSGTEAFDADKIGSRVVLRHWQPGDRFHPIGLKAKVKIQDWFTNQKIPRERRHKLIIAVTEPGEVFWVEDQRITETFKLTPQTKRRLVWRWKRP